MLKSSESESIQGPKETKGHAGEARSDAPATMSLQTENGWFEETSDFVIVDQPDTRPKSERDPTLTANSATAFNIDLNYSGPAQYQSYFNAAIAVWESIITADIADAFDSNGILVDDLRVDATIEFIDGAGGILGSAGPTELRPGSNLPITGIMRFDSADIANMEANGTLQNVITHELGHVLGIGTLWSLMGLTGSGAQAYEYLGANGLREYQTLTGSDNAFVPIEEDGGPGTAGGHWDETLFDSEMMTGYVEAAGVTMPISRVTIGSMEDMGYSVDYSQADAFSLPLGAPADDAGASIAGALTVGTNGVGVTGTIGTGGDTDWFAINVIAGQTYVIDLKGTGAGGGTLPDALIRGIYDSTGALVPGLQDDQSGAGNDSQLTVTAPTTGTYYIEAAGWAGAVGTYTLEVTELAPKPDLIVSNLTVSEGSAANGETITVTFDVENLGGGASVATDVELRLSTNTLLTSFDTLINTTAIGPISAGGTQSFTATFALPDSGTISPGNFYLGAIVDPGSLVDESNEANNNDTYVSFEVTPELEDAIIVYDSSGNITLRTTSLATAVSTAGSGDRIEVNETPSDMSSSSYVTSTGGFTINLNIDGDFGQFITLGTGLTLGGIGKADLLWTDSLFSGVDVTLTGNSADNALTSGAGIDVLIGGGGEDTLDAGGGAHSGSEWQYLYGQAGGDTYKYRAESGQTFILAAAEGAEAGTTDTIIIEGFRVSDLQVSSIDYGALGATSEGHVLSFRHSSGELRVSQGGQYFEAFVFADEGMTFSNVVIGDATGGTLSGTAGNDLMIGGSAADSLFGAAGADYLDAGSAGAGVWQYLYGQAGGDTYNYGSNGGNTFILASAEGVEGGTTDKVSFSGLRLADMTISSIDYAALGAVSEGQVLSFKHAGGELRVSQSGQNIEAFEFVEQGVTFTNVGLASAAGGNLTGTAANDLMIGGAAADSLFGAGGSDYLDAGAAGAGAWQYLYGQAGGDFYSFSATNGNVFVLASAEGAEAGTTDTISIGGLRISDLMISSIDYAALGATSEGQVLSFQHASGELRVSQGGQNIEVFEFVEDGLTFNNIMIADAAGGDMYGTAQNDMMLGGAGADSLFGSEGADYLDAGAAGAGDWQYLYGLAGSDIYNYGATGGSTFITWSAESVSSTDTDKVIMDGLGIGDVTISALDYAALGDASQGQALRFVHAGGELRIGASAQGIEEFVFADGTSYTNAAVATSAGGTTSGGNAADLVIGGSGIDTLFGGAADDYLDAGLGAASGAQWQYLYGETGGDTYAYSKSGGQVFILASAEGAEAGVTDKFVFKDLNFADVTVTGIDYAAYGAPEQGQVLSFSHADGEVRIALGGQHIEEFVFADGTVMAHDDFII